MTLKALLFDVDGTLAETEEVHRIAFNKAFEKAGLDWVWDQPLYHILLGVTGGKERILYHVEREGLDKSAFPPERVKELHLSKTDFYVEMVAAGEIELRPGVEALLREAMAEGIRLAITTTTSRVNVERLIKATLGAEAMGWFEVFVTGDRVTNKKPDPEIYELALSDMNLPGEACVAVEDAPQGLVSSLGAGVPTIVTESSYSEGKNFEGALKVIGMNDPRPTLADIRRWYKVVGV